MKAQGLGDVVVTPHVLATQAGIDVLARGGNAVDAAVAANAVQGVVAPETCGIGGDLFALIYRPGDPAPAALNASGPAGSGADPDELRRRRLDHIPPFHPLSVTIPGCVAGWEALLSRFGTMALSDVLEPAIRLASDGFPASTELSRAVEARDVSAGPSGAELYVDGAPPRPGRVIRRPLLAATLKDVAAQGSRAFYRGEPAQAISEAVDHRITPDDLAAYQPEWVTPLSLDLFGHTGWTIPPNSQGYLTLATLKVFSLAQPPSDPDDPLWWHLLIEAYRALAWERDRLVADPRHANVEIGRLLDDARLAERAGRISHHATLGWPSPAERPGGTAYLCAVDRRGMGVSLIQSNFWGLGSGIGAGTAGFLLHNRGAGFDLDPSSPNCLAPGKRPLHTLSPTLWTTGDRLAALLGTRGGDQQPQLVAQMAARLFQVGQDPEEAQTAPRWWTDRFRSGEASLVRLEGHASASVVNGLTSRGHRVEKLDRMMPGWGPVSVITIDGQGVRTGVADPRIDTAAAAAR